MSHSTVTFSAPGTPLPDRTVGELVAERPGRSRIFQAHKIDFCCQGTRTLREACERKHVSTDVIVAELEKELEDKTDTGPNPAEFAPEALCEHIVETHHGFLRRELPRIDAMAERVATVHGGHTPSLVEVFQEFRKLAHELVTHTLKEEEEVFPAIVKLSRGESAADSLGAEVTAMMREHDDAGESLARLRELTGDYQPPPEACNTYRALFDGLKDLEEDMHRHVHLENTVLFPAARKLAGIGA